MNVDSLFEQAPGAPGLALFETWASTPPNRSENPPNQLR
jgi:hypothetical protein